MFIVNASYLEDSKSIFLYISINKIKVKYATNEKNHEEPSVTDNLVINMPSYFKLF